MNLNFSLKELIHSDIAKQNNIDNTPNIEQCDNLLNLIFCCLQPIRDKIKKPIKVTSGFRCPKVNFFCGGAVNSGHLKGTCADFVINGMTTQEIFNFICNSGVKFTQLIEEHSGNKNWIHIEFDKHNLKQEKLKYINGKYLKIY